MSFTAKQLHEMIDISPSRYTTYAINQLLKKTVGGDAQEQSAVLQLVLMQQIIEKLDRV